MGTRLFLAKFCMDVGIETRPQKYLSKPRFMEEIIYATDFF